MFFPFVFFLVIDFSHIYCQVFLSGLSTMQQHSLPPPPLLPFLCHFLSLFMFSHRCTQQDCIYTSDGQKNSFIIRYYFPNRLVMMASIFFPLINIHHNLFLKCMVLCVLTNVYNQMYTDKYWSCSHCLQFYYPPPKFYRASFQSTPTNTLSPSQALVCFYHFTFSRLPCMWSHTAWLFIVAVLFLESHSLVSPAECITVSLLFIACI